MFFTSIYLNITVCLLLLLYQWKLNRAIIYLVFIILLSNIRQLTLLSLTQTSSTQTLAILILHFDPLIALIGPLLYLYLKSTVQQRLIFEKKHLLFLIPPILILMNYSPYYFQDFNEKLRFSTELQHSKSILNLPGTQLPGGELWINYRYSRHIMHVYNMVMIPYSINYLIQQKNNRTNNARIVKLLQNIFWIILLIVLPTIFQVLYLTFYTHFSFIGNGKRFDSVFSSFSYLTSLILPMSFLLYPRWLYGTINHASLFEQIRSIFSRISPFSNGNKEEKSADLERIVRYIETKKPFLRTEFSVHDVSRELNIPHIRVSNCINKGLSMSFPEYRNRERIKYAIELLEKNTHHHMSIEGIALQCGFKNKSSFYAAFRAVSGMTPSEWIAKNL